MGPIHQKTSGFNIVGECGRRPLVNGMTVGTVLGKTHLRMRWVAGRVVLDQVTGHTAQFGGLMREYGRLPCILGMTGFTKILGEAAAFMVRILSGLEAALMTSRTFSGKTGPLLCIVTGIAVVRQQGKVGASDLVSCQPGIMIEDAGFPRNLGMTAQTFHAKPILPMVRAGAVRGLCVVTEMATFTGTWEIISIRVAADTRHLHMCPNQGEGGLIMVDTIRIPIDCRMTDLAGRGKATSLMVRVIGLIVIRFMTAEAI